MGLGDRRLRHTAKGLASTRRLAILLVRGEVEGDEEDEVGGENSNTGKGGELLSSTLAGVGHPLEVGGGEVGVGRVVDEALDFG